MASSLRVNSIIPSSGTNVAIGTAGGTVTYAASVSGISTFSNGIIVSAGSASAPSISPSGDSNTGIFFPSADTIAFAEGGVEAARFDSSGNLQLPTAGTSILNSSGRKILNQTGSILQVVQTVKTDTFTGVANGTALSVTGMSASITPSSTSNKILIIAHIMYSSTGTTYGGWFRRSGVDIGIGDASGSKQRVATGMALATDTNQSNTFIYSFLDTPSTTSSLTYQLFVNNDNGQTFYLNRSVADQDNSTGKRGISTITLLEVSG